MTRDQVAALVYAAVDELNDQLEPGRLLEKTPDEPLLGEQRKVDSLALVNLIVDIEQRISDELGVTVSLADERAMSRKSSPFRTLGTLTDYAALLVDEASGG